MAEARSRDAWARTSALMALNANCHRDPKKCRPFRPRDFDPHAGDTPPGRQELKGGTKTMVGLEVLKQVFVDRGRSA